jgi:hypothetical protein
LHDAAIDRAARQSGRPRRRAHTPMAVRQRFVRRNRSPATLVEEACRPPIAQAYVINVDHLHRFAYKLRVALRKLPILLLRSACRYDSFVSRRALSPRRRVRVVEKEAQHLSRRIGPARVRVGALETAAGPCVATPVHNPLFQHLRPEIVCM